MTTPRAYVVVVFLLAAACGGEAPPPKPATASPQPAAADAGVDDGDARDAAPVVDATAKAAPAPDPKRVLRGELVRTHDVLGAVSSFSTLPCGRPVGAPPGCAPKDEASMIRDKLARVAKRLEEVQAFASAHPDASPTEASCIRGILDAGEKLAKDLDRGGAASASRAALRVQIKSCDDSLRPAIAALGDPLPVRQQGEKSHGRLAPTEIQRLVRANFGRFKLCYEEGLRRNPSLAGRVSTSFIIDTDGTTLDARAEESTLPDPVAVECIARTFDALRFPPPEGGYVTVVYPLIFAPGDQ